MTLLLICRPRRKTVTEFPRASTEKARERKGRVATPEKHIKKLWDNVSMVEQRKMSALLSYLGKGFLKKNICKMLKS